MNAAGNASAAIEQFDVKPFARIVSVFHTVCSPLLLVPFLTWHAVLDDEERGAVRLGPGVRVGHRHHDDRVGHDAVRYENLEKEKSSE